MVSEMITRFSYLVHARGGRTGYSEGGRGTHDAVALLPPLLQTSCKTLFLLFPCAGGVLPGPTSALFFVRCYRVVKLTARYTQRKKLHGH